MSEVIIKNQFMIGSTEARAIGKTGMGIQTSEMIKELFDNVCRSVLNGEDDLFVVQWAVIKLDKEEKNAINERKEH